MQCNPALDRLSLPGDDEIARACQLLDITLVRAQDASALNAAFSAKVKRAHPDRGGQQADLAQVQAAYGMLREHTGRIPDVDATVRTIEQVASAKSAGRSRAQRRGSKPTPGQHRSLVVEKVDTVRVGQEFAADGSARAQSAPARTAACRGPWCT